MYSNRVFTDVNQALPLLLHQLHINGAEVGSRAGRTKELTHVGITLTDPCRREILLDERKPSIAAQIAETVWVLAGKDDIEWLGHYLPRAKDFSDDGKRWRAGYGARLRSWPRRDGSGDTVDQLRWVVDHLKNNRSSRQAVMSIWDPVIDTQPGKDIPCNDWLSFSSRLGRLDLHVALRSNDVIWGWSGINQFEWSTMLEVVAGLLGAEVGSLHFSTTSFHIYEHHWEKGRRIAQQVPPSRDDVQESPRFDPSYFNRDFDSFDRLLGIWFEIEELIRRGGDADAAVDAFPEPMLQSWLRVLQWWWTGERDYLDPLRGTALEQATHVSVQPPEREAKPGQEAGYRDVMDALADGQDTGPEPSAFIESLCRLHLEKHAAYGDSWVKRGELFSILPNIGRKVDRLGNGETADETSADTAGDLLVYLAKYDAWLQDPENGKDPHRANAVLRETEDVTLGRSVFGGDLVASLKFTFEQLLVQAEAKRRRALVLTMLPQAYTLARMLWEREREQEQDEDEYRGADAD